MCVRSLAVVDDLQVLLLGVYGGASEARGQEGSAEAQAEGEAQARLSPKVALESPSISRTWILLGARGLVLKPRQTLQKLWCTLHLHQRDHKMMVNPTMHLQVIHSCATHCVTHPADLLLRGNLVCLAYAFTLVKLTAVHQGLLRTHAKHPAFLGIGVCPVHAARPTAATDCSMVALVMHLLQSQGKVACFSSACKPLAFKHA